MRFRPGGPTGIRMSCSRCHGLGHVVAHVCLHRDAHTQRPCGMCRGSGWLPHRGG